MSGSDYNAGYEDGVRNERIVYQPVKMKIVGKKIVKTGWTTKTNRTKE